MAWTDKVDDTTERDTVISEISTDLGSGNSTTVSRTKFASFLDGTETIDDCHEFCQDQVTSGTNGWSIETGAFTLADGYSVLTINIIEPS